MRQAQEMQSKMQEAQSKLDDIEATGTSGGDLVRVTLKGKGALQSLAIDPSLLSPEEAEIVEDLIKAAHDDARRKLDLAMQKAMQEATKGLGDLGQMIPGFKMPF